MTISTPQPHAYKPGDVVNNHVLTSDNRWVPVGQVGQVPSSRGPMTHANLNVRRDVVYTRQQKAHSVTLHILLAFLTGGISLCWTIYYAISPNHYFHA